MTDLTNQWHAARVPGEPALLTHHDGLLRAAEGRSIVVEAFHGAFVLGRTPAETFFKAFYLDQACNVQLAVQSAGAAGAAGPPLMQLSQAEIDRHLADMAASDWYGYEGALEWEACLRSLEREAPHYRS